ncbi:MAG: AMIN domain-containing protein, partial [Nitrospinota bacterium]|nr:AMIN domain-containing protein [Nitrospinota bacterium]
MAFIHRISGYLLVLALLVSPSCSSTSTSAPTKFIPIGSKYITRIEPVQKQDLLELTVEGSSKLQYTIFRLSNPRRLVIDIPNMDSSAFSAPIELKEGLATEVQSSFFPQSGNSRIEIMLNEPVLYKVSRVTDEKILVSLSPYDLEFGKKRQVKEGEVEITGIELREMSGLARVVISYNGEKPKFQMIRKREKNRITIDIYNAKVLRANERLHTVTAKESNVESVALYQFATDPEGLVKVVAELREFTSSNIFERKGELVLDMGSEAIISTASVVA